MLLSNLVGKMRLKQKNGVEPSKLEVYKVSHESKEKHVNDKVANVIVS